MSWSLVRVGAVLVRRFTWLLTASAVLSGCGNEAPAPKGAEEPEAAAGAANPSASGGTGEAGQASGPSAKPPVASVACSEDTECDDGQACNGRETCDGGFCAVGEAVDCDDKLGCTADYCDQKTGKCSHEAPDDDGDGFTAALCVDADGAPLGDDCDDEDSDRYPGNAETCTAIDDSHDEDCDPTTFGAKDADGDGFVDHACQNADGEQVFAGEDCDDAARSVNPDTSEVCDGFDNNCNGKVDEGLLIVGYRDKDGDGYGVPVTAADALPGEVFDGEGRLSVCPGTPAFAEKSIDCDDANPLVRPESFELCDGIDNDCDEAVDENVVKATWYADFDRDGFGNPAMPLRVSCEPQAGYSLYPTDCDDRNELVNPLQVELCDGIDNDCNDKTGYSVAAGDLEDDDNDGFADPRCGTKAPDCDDQDRNTRPGARELCDGIDNDCNGVADTQVQSALWYRDEDGDGWGNPISVPIDSCDVVAGRVPRPGDCDDRDVTRNPDQKDDCAGVPGSDDNCDGKIDESEVAQAYYLDSDGDGFGKLGSTPYLGCLQPAGWATVSADCNDLNSEQAPDVDEVCTLGDGIDDDCDGAVDCADAECLLTADCAGLLLVNVVSPAGPLTGFVATPFQVTLSVKTPAGVVAGFYKLDAQCSDGAYAATSTVTTDAAGLATLTVYPGLAPGNYECDVAGAATLPFKLKVQALAPPLGTVHTTFNVGQLTSAVAATTGVAALGASLVNASALDVADDGTLYLLAGSPAKIYEVSPRGVVKDLLALHGATIPTPNDLALDREADVLYVLSSSAALYSLNLSSGGVTKVAGGGSTSVFQEGMSGVDYKLTAPHRVAVYPGVGVAVADTSKDVIRLRADGTLSRWQTNQACIKLPCVAACAASSCFVAVSDAGALLMTANFNTETTSNDLLLARLTASQLPGQLTFSTGSGAELPLNALAVGTPHGLAFDDAGNLLLAHDNRVRWIGRTELVARDVIGGPAAGATGDYGLASQALVQNLRDVALDGLGNLWLLEGGSPSRVRRVWRPTPPTAISGMQISLKSAAPTGLPGHPASAVQLLVESAGGAPVAGMPVFFDSTASALSRQGPALTGPTGLATRSLWTSMTPGDYTFTAKVEDLTGAPAAELDLTAKVSTPAPGTITSLANLQRGAESTGYWKDSDWAPGMGKGYFVSSVAARADGTIYFTSYYGVYRLGTDGSLRRVAGGGSSAPDHVPGLAANFPPFPGGLAIDDNLGRAYFTVGSRIYVLELDDHVVWTLTGQGSADVDGGLAKDWSLASSYALAVSKDGKSLYLDHHSSSPAIHRIDLSASPPTRHLVLPLQLDSGACGTTPLRPYAQVQTIRLAVADDGMLYGTGRICDGVTSSSISSALFRLDPKASPQTPSIALLAPISIHNYGGMDLDAAGRVYFHYYSNSTVVRWDPSGGFTHLAGTGTPGDSGDLGPATVAQLDGPRGVSLTSDGHLLIADYANSTIRKVWSP